MNYSFEEVEPELSPCLIGSTHTKNPTSRVIRSYLTKSIPTYSDPETGGVYSVDNLRYRLHSSPSKLSQIADALDRYNSGTDDVITYSQGSRIGSYRYLWQFRYSVECDQPKEGETTSVVVGYCLIKGNGGIDEGAGFIEFNPAKLSGQGFQLLRFLSSFDVKAQVARWDLAIDYPLQRDLLRIKKDGRKYACEISDSMTEYLGQRSKPGRVKLYDKAAERGYIGDLTRVELTVSGDWKIDTIMAQLPVVYSYHSGSFYGLKGVTLAFATTLKALADIGNEPIETWLRLVDPKTRAKIRKLLSSNFTLVYSRNIVSFLRQSVLETESLT